MMNCVFFWLTLDSDVQQFGRRMPSLPDPSIRHQLFCLNDSRLFCQTRQKDAHLLIRFAADCLIFQQIKRGVSTQMNWWKLRDVLTSHILWIASVGFGVTGRYFSWRGQEFDTWSGSCSRLFSSTELLVWTAFKNNWICWIYSKITHDWYQRQAYRTFI